MNKSTGLDLQQGRLTLPLLTALEALQSEGRSTISIDRLRKARLTTTEMKLVERAIAEDAVSAWLDEEVRRQMRDVEKSARATAVPCGATTAALDDMETKISLFR